MKRERKREALSKKCFQPLSRLKNKHFRSEILPDVDPKWLVEVENPQDWLIIDSSLPSNPRVSIADRYVKRALMPDKPLKRMTEGLTLLRNATKIANLLLDKIVKEETPI